jgi:hypothetical protein
MAAEEKDAYSGWMPAELTPKNTSAPGGCQKAVRGDLKVGGFASQPTPVPPGLRTDFSRWGIPFYPNNTK